jgi:TPR repeat protein
MNPTTQTLLAVTLCIATPLWSQNAPDQQPKPAPNQTQIKLDPKNRPQLTPEQKAEAAKFLRPLSKYRVLEIAKEAAQQNLDPTKPLVLIVSEQFEYQRGLVFSAIVAAKTNKEKEQLRFQQYLIEARYGDPTAQYNLAKQYATGAVVPRDTRKAFLWSLSAARNGHPAASAAVGMAYAYSKEFVRSLFETIKEHKVEERLLDISLALEKYSADGTGVDRDYKKAWVWFHKAAEDRDAFPELLIEGLEKLMSDEEIAEASQMLKATETAPSIRDRGITHVILSDEIAVEYLRATQPWLFTEEYRQN